MKKLNIVIPISFLLIASITACNNTVPPVGASLGDTRTASQVDFMTKIKEISEDMELYKNPIKKDLLGEKMTKYMLDSLKDISDWELIVEAIDDNNFASSKVASVVFGSDTEVYNLKMISILDKPSYELSRADTVSIDNLIRFTYTIPKKPQGEPLQRQLEVIKELTVGDTVLVSGSVTTLDNNMKVNFRPLLDDSYYMWDLDFLVTNIKKK